MPMLGHPIACTAHADKTTQVRSTNPSNTRHSDDDDDDDDDDDGDGDDCGDE